jgi:hypothetical protein
MAAAHAARPRLKRLISGQQVARLQEFRLACHLPQYSPVDGPPPPSHRTLQTCHGRQIFRQRAQRGICQSCCDDSRYQTH